MPFLPQAKRVEALRSIYGENTVHMVDLVLEELRTITLDLHFRPFPLQILIPDPNPVRSGHSYQELGKRETVVPDLEVLVSDVHDLWVYQRPRLVHLYVNHSNRRPDLGCRDGSSASKAGLPITKRLTHVVHDDSNRSGLRLRNRLAFGPKDGVAEKSDAVNGHFAPGRLEERIFYPSNM
jgi:hypothetical protein